MVILELAFLFKERQCCVIERRGVPRSLKMLLALFVILLILWILGFIAFHVTSGLIHILLVIAIICLIVHFVRRARA